MSSLPKILVSSVVRGANQGDSHGGLYLVDLETGSHEQLVDWNDGSINFEGRGADRGLRGIAICDDTIYVAASDELFAYDREFRIVASYRNDYLKHCHEIFAFRGRLYLTSTGFDSILGFDLGSREFDFGLGLNAQQGRVSVRPFDPMTPGGPPARVDFHLNNVHVTDFGMFVSGRKLPALLRITPQTVEIVADLPIGTHNAAPYKNGVIFNDTEQDHLVWISPTRTVAVPTPRYPDAELLCADADASGVARQAFGRGLCPIGDLLVAGGSSPTTISVYDLDAAKRTKSVNLTMDVRNAAHGLALWPY